MSAYPNAVQNGVAWGLDTAPLPPAACAVSGVPAGVSAIPHQTFSLSAAQASDFYFELNRGVISGTASYIQTTDFYTIHVYEQFGSAPAGEIPQSKGYYQDTYDKTRLRDYYSAASVLFDLREEEKITAPVGPFQLTPKYANLGLFEGQNRVMHYGTIWDPSESSDSSGNGLSCDPDCDLSFWQRAWTINSDGSYSPFVINFRSQILSGIRTHFEKIRLAYHPAVEWLQYTNGAYYPVYGDAASYSGYVTQYSATPSTSAFFCIFSATALYTRSNSLTVNWHSAHGFSFTSNLTVYTASATSGLNDVTCNLTLDLYPD